MDDLTRQEIVLIAGKGVPCGATRDMGNVVQ